MCFRPEVTNANLSAPIPIQMETAELVMGEGIDPTRDLFGKQLLLHVAQEQLLSVGYTQDLWTS